MNSNSSKSPNMISKIKSSHNNTFKPLFFRPNNPKEKEKLIELINSGQELSIHNEIIGQLEELMKSKNPKKKFNSKELAEYISLHLGNTDIDDYGVWIYYPWSNRLVHSLDEEEFIKVRTNRNHYKITPEEEKILATKRIGVMGLSVGKAVAVTIAMERICGELVLADFDILELSNLNRIQTGIQNFGIKKTIVVAREIAEIDPYLKVTCYSEGITETNINDFLTKGGKLDVCVEVCDGLYIKILARQKAKELGIPVVMNSSDRGVTDIERFDLEPDRSILHGLIDHLDLSLVKQAKTNEEKVPYILPMLGIETSSNRMKSSLLEIEQSITTWPQLASAVILGGGICTDICRRILLGHQTKSGRFFVDLEDNIPNDNIAPVIERPLRINEPLTSNEMLSIIREKKNVPIEHQIDLDKDTVKDIVKFATKAPSGANGQSWKWMYDNKTLYLFFDDIFRPELLGCKRTTSLVGLGAATENVVLRAHQLGYEVIIDTVDIDIDKPSKLITTYRFFKEKHKVHNSKFEPHICDHLAKTIESRISNRNTIKKSEPINKSRLDKLKEIAQTIPGADLLIIDDPDQLKKMADITGKMDRIRYTSETGHYDFRAEARWTAEDAMKTKNGIYFKEAVDLTPTEFMGFYISKDWPVVKNLADWGLGTGFEKIQRKWINGSAAVGLITVPSFATNDFFEGGRALQRIWLSANQDNISVHPPSLSVLVFNSMVYDEREVLSKNLKTEAMQLLKEFDDMFNVDSKKGKVLLLRFFIGEPPKYRTLKYDNDQILSFSNT